GTKRRIETGYGATKRACYAIQRFFRKCDDSFEQTLPRPCVFFASLFAPTCDVADVPIRFAGVCRRRSGTTDSIAEHQGRCGGDVLKWTTEAARRPVHRGRRRGHPLR